MPAEDVDVKPAGAAARPRGDWLRAFAVYGDRRIIVIFFMGFSSGLPLLLTLSTLSYWLAKVGVDKTSIGLFALVGLPYSLKFLWAPVIDQVRIPGLARLLGHRRSWRSEEHTSELQSLMRISYAVFCLKKKNI